MRNLVVVYTGPASRPFMERYDEDKHGPHGLDETQSGISVDNHSKIYDVDMTSYSEGSRFDVAYKDLLFIEKLEEFIDG